MWDVAVQAHAVNIEGLYTELLVQTIVEKRAT